MIEKKAHFTGKSGFLPGSLFFCRAPYTCKERVLNALLNKILKKKPCNKGICNRMVGAIKPGLRRIYTAAVMQCSNLTHDLNGEMIFFG